MNIILGKIMFWARVFDLEDAKRKILHRMFYHEYIGGRHTAVENLRKGFDKNDYPVLEEAIDDLVKEGLIHLKPTSYGLHASLSASRIADIKKFLGLA